MKYQDLACTIGYAFSPIHWSIKHEIHSSSVVFERHLDGRTITETAFQFLLIMLQNVPETCLLSQTVGLFVLYNVFS